MKKKWIATALAVVVVLAGVESLSSRPQEPTEETEHYIGQQETAKADSEKEIAETGAVEDEKATTGEQNALRSAQNYLDIMPFSYEGLIAQLEYEQFTQEEAVYAADHCGADWMEQAAKAAENYLEIMAFSKEGLIDQLEYDGFTTEQATYGAEQKGY